MNKTKRSRIICLLCALLLTITVMSQNLAHAASFTVTQGVRKYFTAAAGGETLYVTLYDAYTSVTLKGRPNWVTATKNGNKYTLKVQAIPNGTQTRQSDVVWVDGSKTYTLRITQFCAHTYGWETTTYATCCKAGVQTYRCTKCKKVYSGTNSRSIAPTGNHKWGNWKTTKAATCTTNGTKIRYCVNPGGTASQTATIYASHKFTTGSNNERYCSVCKLPDYSYYMNSSTHWVSNSCHDEKGNSSKGQAGDNNGDEWKMDKSFATITLSYLSSSEKKNVVISIYRYTKNSNVGDKLARLSIEAALNNNIGYDQSQNYTYKTELSMVGWDPKAVKTACEQDCAAGVSTNVIAVGNLLKISDLSDMTMSDTSCLGSALEKAGFVKIKSGSSLSSDDISSLRAGDILIVRYEKLVNGEWKGRGHALVNVTGK